MKTIRLSSLHTWTELRSWQATLTVGVILFGTLFAAATNAFAQEIVRQQAPPEIRTLFQAMVQGANGDAAAWEAFAQAHFTDALLKKQTPAQRAELHKQIADRFGTIAIGAARREGPDAPLQLIVKGSKAEGTIVVDLDLGSPKIFSIGVE